MSQVTLLITACSKDKRAARSIGAADLGCLPAGLLAREWIARLEGSDRMPARDRYRGRGHRQAAAAVERYGASHLIVSAGLGLVRASEPIPAYRLTFKIEEEDSILPHIAKPDGIQNWWEAVELSSPWSRHLEDEWDGSSLIVIALPAGYLQILPALLARLPRSAKPRIRLINASVPTALPQVLRAYHLPYDARFNGPDSADRGIGSDFLGRAVSHFLALIQDAPHGSIDEHRRLVEDVLKSMRPAERRQGRSLSDDAVSAVIRSEVESAGPGSARLLRRFREELGIACEQKRFQRLYTNVIANLGRA